MQLWVSRGPLGQGVPRPIAALQLHRRSGHTHGALAHSRVLRACGRPSACSQRRCGELVDEVDERSEAPGDHSLWLSRLQHTVGSACSRDQLTEPAHEQPTWPAWRRAGSTAGSCRGFPTHPDQQETAEPNSQKMHPTLIQGATGQRIHSGDVWYTWAGSTCCRGPVAAGMAGTAPRCDRRSGGALP